MSRTLVVLAWLLLFMRELKSQSADLLSNVHGRIKGLSVTGRVRQLSSSRSFQCAEVLLGSQPI